MANKLMNNLYHIFRGKRIGRGSDKKEYLCAIGTKQDQTERDILVVFGSANSEQMLANTVFENHTRKVREQAGVDEKVRPHEIGQLDPSKNMPCFNFGPDFPFDYVPLEIIGKNWGGWCDR